MLLTIGIPVFNGQKYINDTIESILKYDFDPDEVEIIVSDNASTDRTVQIVNKHSIVKLFEHTENLGFDGNLHRIFTYARGKYVWAIGADDLVVGDIDALLKLLRNPLDFGTIFIGGNGAFRDEYEVVDVAEHFLLKSSFRSGFFPNNIIAKNLWMQCEIQEFINSGWIHYAIVLQVIRFRASVLTRAQYVIENPRANEIKSWNSNGSGLLIGIKLVEIFQIMSRWGYNKKFRKKTKRVIKNSFPRVIIVAKMRGFKISSRLLSDFIRLFKEYPSFWLLDLWVLLIPSFVYIIISKPLKWFKVLG
jgi:glycosyltransferase involved in cell wall biosynthesis